MQESGIEAKQRAGDAAQQRAAAQASQVNTAPFWGLLHWPAKHVPDMLCVSVEAETATMLQEVEVKDERSCP